MGFAGLNPLKTFPKITIAIPNDECIFGSSYHHKSLLVNVIYHDMNGSFPLAETEFLFLSPPRTGDILTLQWYMEGVGKRGYTYPTPPSS